MQKIRINDLARELEVKSKMILDALIKVGVTEKKTHSSSIEVDEAERVKKYFAEHAEPGTSRASSRASADEFKPKLDLSHISKPGDVLKAVTQRAAQPSAVARPATAPPAPPDPGKPSRRRQLFGPRHQLRNPSAPVASATPVAPAEPPKPAPRFITPQSVARPPAAIVIPPKPPVAAPPATPPAHLSSAAATAQPSEPVIEDQITALEESEALPSTSEAIESEIPTAERRGSGSAIGSTTASCGKSCGGEPSGCSGARCRSPRPADASGTTGNCRACATPFDRSPDRTASGVSGSARRPAASRCSHSSARRHAGAWQADLPASAPGSAAARTDAATGASGRTSWSASNAFWSARNSSGIWSRRRCRPAASYGTTSRRSPGASGTALRSPRREGRPDEGLCSAAAAFAFQRAAADHAEHHDS